MSLRDLLARGTQEVVAWAVDTSLEAAEVAGVALRHDDLWLTLWSVRDLLGAERFDVLDHRLADRWIRRGPWGGPALPWVDVISELDYLPGGPTAQPDPAWRCRAWDLWCERVLGTDGDPVLAELQLFTPPMPGDDTLGRLDMVWREAGIRVGRSVRGGVEYQAAGPRMWQRGGAWGTVGGRLATASFGDCVTGSAHVADDQLQPVSVRDVGNSSLGQVADTGAWPDRAHCRDETALVSVAAGSATGTRAAAYAHTDTLFQGMVLDFHGARSGHRQAEIAQVILASKIVCPGTSPLVLRNCLELRRPVNGYFRQRWSRPSRPGDSGAWLMAGTAAGPTWCATIVGGDSVSTKATFAESTVERFAGEVNLPAV